MTTIGLYVPGRSVIHRLPAGWKLALLVITAAASALVRTPVAVAASLLAVLLLFAVARVGWRTVLAQVRPVLWFAVPLFAFHLVVSDWRRAVQVVGVLLALVLLAALVSLTTKVSDLCDVVVRAAGPLRRVGLEPERLGLLVALGIRAVPVMVTIAHEVRDAQRARGASASPAAYVLPILLRALRHADRQAEALVARGLDD